LSHERRASTISRRVRDVYGTRRQCEHGHHDGCGRLGRPTPVTRPRAQQPSPTLDIIEREGLDTRARSLEGPLAAALEPLTKHPLVAEVRVGVGLLAAVQLDPARVEEQPSLPLRVAAASREAGVITRALAGGGLQISPALVIDEQQIEELAAGVRAGLDAASAGLLDRDP
jgi:4-aminobutyrate aminotransferase-like enzyme